MEEVRLLILGGGPAGYTAAIYACRAGLEPVLLEGPQPGGQLTTTTMVENFPGFPGGVDAFSLMTAMRDQAKGLGADIRTGIAVKADLSSRPFRIETDGGDVFSAESLIIATGATAKYLGLPSEKEFRGRGVSACATCDGFFYRTKVTAVVGGGDTACEEADYLSHLANKVYLIVRKDYLRASEAMQQRVKENEKIEILFNTNTVGLFGDNGVEGAHLVRFKGTDKEEFFDIAIDGFFLAIGHRPNTEFLGGQIDLDEQGYIKLAGHNTATNVEGVFAAGDVADPHYRQAIAAAAAGCRAAIDVKQYLS